VIVNGRRIDLPVTTKGRKLQVAVRPALDEQCESGITGTDTARIVFRGTDESEIPLANVPLQNCVIGAKARAHIRDARIQLRQSTGSSVLHAIDETAQAKTLVQALPESDVAKPQLRSDLDAVQRDIQTAVTNISDDGLGTLFAKTKPTGDDLLREGSAALVLASKRPEPALAWQNTMRSIAARVSPGTGGYLELVAIVKKAGLNDCLIGGWQCPEWLTSDSIVSATQHLSSDFVRGASATSKQLITTTRGMSRAPTLKAGLAAEAALSAAGDWFEACGSENELQIASIRTACSDLLAKADDARKVMDANHEILSRLKEEAAQRERNEHQKKGLRLWKDQFARCRRLGSALPEAERLRAQGRCGSECQDAIAKMKKDLERLEQFRGDTDLDSSTMETVRRECQDARCPNCP
jgi:hypothetical protein